MSTRTKRKPPLVPFERFELSCGVVLLVSQREGAPVTAIQAHVRGGHSLDPKSKHGVAAMMGSMLDQGTESHDEAQIGAALEPIGGSLSGGSTGLNGTVASGSWKKLLDLFCESLVTPTFPAERLARQRERAMDALRLRGDDPRSQAELRFRGLVYGDNWLGRSESGTVGSVKSMRRADLAKFHKQNWVACRAVIGVSGDIKPDVVARYLDRRLSKWATGKPLDRPDLKFPKPGVRSDVFSAKRQQVHVHLGHLGIRRSDPDYAALVVMDYILGTGPGFSNRISKRLRDELGLAYSVHAAISHSAGFLPGMFSAYIGTSPEHFGTALEGFLREMRRIRDVKVSASELRLVKNYLSGSFAMAFERASRRAGHLIAVERNGFPEDHIERLLAQFQAVTVKDVQRAAQAHLMPDKTVLSVGGPIKARDVAKLHKQLSKG